ncbi:MAG: isocitrate lyase/PEP mutase family protein [Deltaproteobacteria bacterium]|nr:isocitrate lyase/PEP mutase family protein [Deltaproteobacteria bacterium]
MAKEPGSTVERLRAQLEKPGLRVMPCCFDALSARLVERAGFELTFMSGFAVSAARIGQPDTGLISYGEMVDAGRDICAAVSIPVLGDGDTGYGNAINVKRTVRGYAQAGFAAVMIEDQVAPKRCGHTRGKQVVERQEAIARIAAAVDARNEGADILILARTDARTTDGFDEAMYRVSAFADLGADILFLEAPESESEMERFCKLVTVPTLANMVEGGKTPVLPPAKLEAMGYRIAAYPMTLQNAAVGAMNQALSALRAGTQVPGLMDFPALREILGFDSYYDEEERYRR